MVSTADAMIILIAAASFAIGFISAALFSKHVIHKYFVLIDKNNRRALDKLSELASEVSPNVPEDCEADM